MQTQTNKSSQNWVEKYLHDNFIKFEEHTHEPKYTTQEVAQAEHISGHRVAKVVVAMSGQTPSLLVLPASYMVDLAMARKSTGINDLRFATEYEIENFFPDCQIGAVPPLPKWSGIKIYMDPSMRHPGNFLFQAASHEQAILMKFSDWYEVANPIEITFAQAPGPESHNRQATMIYKN